METLFTGKPVWWLGICMLLLTTPVFAQTITGSISDAGGGKLPGVSVVLKGTQKGTLSNADGAYSLAVSGPTSLRSYFPM